MRNRIRNAHLDQKIFRKTADKGKAVNVGRITSRGGILF